MHVCGKYLYVFFCTYVQIHQFVFDKNTCRIRTNRFTDGNKMQGNSRVREMRSGAAVRCVCGGAVRRRERVGEAMHGEGGSGAARWRDDGLAGIGWLRRAAGGGGSSRCGGWEVQSDGASCGG